jgi:solute carrier family 35 protein E1
MAEQPKKTRAIDLAGWVVLLIATQMVMLIFGKKVTAAAKLPLVLCIAQFTTSATLAAAISLAQGRGLPWMPRELWWIIIQLSAVWTAGFVLFNASATEMSPGYVNLIRCAEPLVTVTLGLLLGARYAPSVLATLIPICGGVALASFKGGIPSTLGVALAMCSNACFCGRPFFKQQLKQSKANKVRFDPQNAEFALSN